MLGWLAVFALFLFCSILAMLTVPATTMPAIVASLLFGLLFLLCLVTRAVRGRA